MVCSTSTRRRRLVCAAVAIPLALAEADDDENLAFDLLAGDDWREALVRGRVLLRCGECIPPADDEDEDAAELRNAGLSAAFVSSRSAVESSKAVVARKETDAAMTQHTIRDSRKMHDHAEWTKRKANHSLVTRFFQRYFRLPSSASMLTA